MSYARTTLGCHPPLSGLGFSPIMIVGLGVLVAPFVFLMGVSLKIQYLESHCAPDNYNEADCKRARELRAAAGEATGSGEVTPNSLLAARSALSALGEDVSAFPSSFSSDFSIPVSDLSAVLASLPSALLPDGVTREGLDAVVEVLAPTETPPSQIDPSTVTVTADPETGAITASSSPSPLVLVGGLFALSLLAYVVLKKV